MTHKVSPGEWIRLESAETPSERAKIDDISVIFRVSPYDVPEAIRGSCDPQTGRLRIELRYLADEPTEAHRQDDDVVLHVGKRSGRLYGVELPSGPHGVATLRVRFETESLRKALADAKPTSKRPRNLELAGRAISDHMSELVAAAC